MDTVENIVYGQVSSLSWFFIGEPSVLPVADAGGPYLAPIGNSTSLDGSAYYHPDGTMVGYDWDFGDNTTGAAALVSHAYAAPGVYTVVLMVADTRGAQASATTLAVAYDPLLGFRQRRRLVLVRQWQPQTRPGIGWEGDFWLHRKI